MDERGGVSPKPLKLKKKAEMMSQKSNENLKQNTSELKVLPIKRNVKDVQSLKQKPVRVRSGKDAKKLLSRLLVAFQRGEVANDEARTIAHLLSVFIQIEKEIELLERIEKLEARITKY